MAKLDFPLNYIKYIVKLHFDNILPVPLFILLVLYLDKKAISLSASSLSACQYVNWKYVTLLIKYLDLHLKRPIPYKLET